MPPCLKGFDSVRSLLTSTMTFEPILHNPFPFDRTRSIWALARYNPCVHDARSWRFWQCLVSVQCWPLLWPLNSLLHLSFSFLFRSCKLHLNSCHDTTLMSMLLCLKDFDNAWSPLNPNLHNPFPCSFSDRTSSIWTPAMTLLTCPCCCVWKTVTMLFSVDLYHDLWTLILPNPFPCSFSDRTNSIWTPAMTPPSCPCC